MRTWMGLKAPRAAEAPAAPSHPAPEPPPPSEAPKAVKSELPPQVAGWYAGKDFSNDWTTHKLGPWFEALLPYKEASILEIGSWEGRSAIAFLEILPHSRITCVDTFGGSPNHFDDIDMAGRLPLLQSRFDRNLAAYRSRVRKIVGRAVAVMDEMAQQGEQFDIVYIDASHRRDDVLADSVVAWRLLRVGGLMMWDDLLFKLEWGPAERPADAIEMFCAMFGDCMDEVHRGKQLFARKTAEWPQRFTVAQKQLKARPAPQVETAADK